MGLADSMIPVCIASIAQNTLHPAFSAASLAQGLPGQRADEAKHLPKAAFRYVPPEHLHSPPARTQASTHRQSG